MAKKKENKQPKLTTSKMPAETEQQYAAWLLYCEAGSIKKLLDVWEKVGQVLGETGADFAHRLGKKPSDTTIETWSKKYQWVARTDLRLEEELAELKEKADRFRKKRKFLITDILIQKMTKLQKQAKTQDVSVLEIKYLWEMHRTEWGEATGKTEVTHHIDENEQNPPDQEEDQVGKEIDQVIKKHYDKRRK
jgi:hypothetical protein